MWVGNVNSVYCNLRLYIDSRVFISTWLCMLRVGIYAIYCCSCSNQMASRAIDYAIGSCNPLSAAGFCPKSARVRIFTVKCSAASVATSGASVGSHCSSLLYDMA